MESRSALEKLSNAGSSIADYVHYLEAVCKEELKDYAGAIREANAVIEHSPVSPLLARAVFLAARCSIETGDAARATELLTQHRNRLPEPERELLAGRAREQSGDKAGAAGHYQRVYYYHPSTSEAAQAEDELRRLERELGERFPPATPEAMLERAGRLSSAGDVTRSRAIYTTLLPDLAGAVRDLAAVRVGVADYRARRNDAAYKYLTSLHVKSAEADAERLYYVHAAARRREDDAAALKAVQDLQRYPQSVWRLEALVSAGNHYLLRNETMQYGPLFRSCYESFPNASRAPYCHWKVAWSAYLARVPEAAALLEEHVTRWPGSEKAAAAMYFLGRIKERGGKFPDAKAYYSAIPRHFPNYFHATLARERLEDRKIATAVASSLPQNIRLPERRKLDFSPTSATLARIERADRLSSAGFEDWAEEELRFASKVDAQPHIAGLELAQKANDRGKPDQGIRFIKSLAAGYLSLPFEAAPERFWRLAFPMPFRSLVESYARERDLDPFLLAALIRQESEFNPRAVSRANAHGLTQVMPSTGRQLSRKLGVRPFSSKRLFEPDVNLKLGTWYLQSLLSSFDGKWEPALASYNGGKSRVLDWLQWADYREPAEFIETIPITETRDYVQIILRNADFYRRLYGGKQAAVTSTNGSDPSQSGNGGQ